MANDSPGGGIRSELRRIRLTRARISQVADVGRGAMWLKDSASLLFFWEDKLFLAHPADPRPPRQLLSVAPDEIAVVTISRDNRTVVFGRRVTEADIWLATLK